MPPIEAHLDWMSVCNGRAIGYAQSLDQYHRDIHVTEILCASPDEGCEDRHTSEPGRCVSDSYNVPAVRGSVVAISTEQPFIDQA